MNSRAWNSTGDSLGAIKYLPYGETRSGSVPTDKQFTGQRLDDTGLYYYGARYYDPTIGRFISADTIIPNPADPQSFNRYSYCLNNPLKYVDPSGRNWFENQMMADYLNNGGELTEEIFDQVYAPTGDGQSLVVHELGIAEVDVPPQLEEQGIDEYPWGCMFFDDPFEEITINVTHKGQEYVVTRKTACYNYQCADVGLFPLYNYTVKGFRHSFTPEAGLYVSFTDIVELAEGTEFASGLTSNDLMIYEYLLYEPRADFTHTLEENGMTTVSAKGVRYYGYINITTSSSNTYQFGVMYRQNLPYSHFMDLAGLTR